MWWLNRKLRSERGASAVLVGILLVPLLGFVAIAVDVGALYAERAQLQNGADAAALAIAQDCADGACTNAQAKADAFTDANANDGAANVLEPDLRIPAKTVTVSSSTRVAGTNADAISHPFARFIGIDSSTVGAEATAEWGSPRASAVVLPLAISYCEFRPALDRTLQLIRYDQNLPLCRGRAGHPIPGGFGWIERVPGECGAEIDLASAAVNSEPGNSYPGRHVCDDTMMDLAGTTVLIPIFDAAFDRRGRDVTSGGPASSYHIYAFAAFKITGWRFAGGNGLPQVSIDAAAPRCNGNCRGIQGYFDRWVSVDAAGAMLGGPNLGASIVRLSN